MSGTPHFDEYVLRVSLSSLFVVRKIRCKNLHPNLHNATRFRAFVSRGSSSAAAAQEHPDDAPARTKLK